MTQDEYCREIESHLCRKNDGHLIRLVGPSFELVCGWASRGIPLKIVLHGIDRYFERSHAPGPRPGRRAEHPARRRPVRIDFCEADVLDAFDEWRRAVGLFLRRPVEGGEPHRSPAAKPRQSLAAHIDRVVGRLVARQTDPATPILTSEIVRVIERLDAIREAAAKARGPARAQLVGELAGLDRALMAAAHDSCSPELNERSAQEAELELQLFRERMPAEAYESALAAATERVIRERLGLPQIAYE